MSHFKMRYIEKIESPEIVSNYLSKKKINKIMAEVNSSNFSSKVHNFNMLNFLVKRSCNDKENDSKHFTKQLWDTAKDLYKKDLIAHYGCVNAIEFSNDGNLLFSGGDDRRVLMWNVNSAMMYYTGNLGDGSKPKRMRACHFSNIFCLAVDDENKRVLSGSNDDQVIVHDYTTGNAVDYFLHDSPVFSLSLHPMNGNIFASAVNNGRILINDIRDSNSDPLCLARARTSFHGVMFNPCEPFLVATANSKLGIHIWDMRKPREVLYECTDERSMAVRWNQSGTILLALRNFLPPIIYNPLLPKKSLEFDADGYYNACTMKSCSFAGDNDEYLLSGSDDFNLYMWKIPDPWPENKWIVKAHLTLKGHRSIVNQVRYDPNKQLIASSGVEKIIKIWSPLRMPYSEGDRDQPCVNRTRVLCSSRACSRSLGLLSHDYSQESVVEDKRMIHFFDSLLRDELLGNTSPTCEQFFCSDGKLVSVPTHKKNPKAFEELINRKKKYLSRMLLGKNDGNLPFCSLNENSNSNRNNFKKFHFILDENQLLTLFEDGGNVDESLESNQAELDGFFHSLNESLNETVSSDSSDNNIRPLSSLSSSSSSSSSAISNGRVQLMIDSPFGNDSHLTSDHSNGGGHTSHSESPFDLDISKTKYYFLKSESEDSNAPEEKSNNLNKDFGVNVSTSSDSDNLKASSSFKKRRINSKSRCYRNSKRKKRSPNSSNPSDVESSSNKNESKSENNTFESKNKNSNNGECLNGISDQKTQNFDNNSEIIHHINEVNSSQSDENDLDSNSENENEKIPKENN